MSEAVHGFSLRFPTPRYLHLFSTRFEESENWFMHRLGFPRSDSDHVVGGYPFKVTFFRSSWQLTWISELPSRNQAVFDDTGGTLPREPFALVIAGRHFDELTRSMRAEGFDIPLPGRSSIRSQSIIDIDPAGNSFRLVREIEPDPFADFEGFSIRLLRMSVCQAVNVSGLLSAEQGVFSRHILEYSPTGFHHRSGGVKLFQHETNSAHGISEPLLVLLDQIAQSPHGEDMDGCLFDGDILEIAIHRRGGGPPKVATLEIRNISETGPADLPTSVRRALLSNTLKECIARLLSVAGKISI